MKCIVYVLMTVVFKNISLSLSLFLYILIKGTSAQNPLPIVYVEGDANEPNIDELMLNKRSGRYYRRYPWKRQNTRSRT